MPRRMKGFFKPLYPQKYKGDPTRIVYRSSWELKLMRYLDKHPDIIEWGSEEIVVPYISPIDNKPHRYYPDFIIKKRNYKTGKIEVEMVEVKPSRQCKPPQLQKKPTRRYISEVYEWERNRAKWNAAYQYCQNRDWKFSVFTEKELGILNV